MELFYQRRSVRKYREGRVSEQDMTKLLSAAMQAPSARNEQPWEFVVIRNRETMLGITSFHPYSMMLKEADCAVAVCGNLQRQKYLQYDYWVQDCAAATENLLLEATYLGLGAVWLAIHPIEERVKGLKALLELPENIAPLCVVALGYPAEKPRRRDTYREEYVHFEKW